MSDIYSKEFPLFQRHLDVLVQGSAISPEIIRERGYRSTLGERELEELGFSKVQRRPPGLIIPIFPPGLDKPALYQFRPDRPRELSGKKVKYETPKGAGLRIDCPPRCQKMIKGPAVPIWITEGIKKGDSLASKGLCAIALLGVWGFRGKNEFGATTTLRDIKAIDWTGRKVYIIFDSDIMTKATVEGALKALATELQERGADVYLVHLDAGKDGAKVGVDDYFAAGGDVSFLSLHSVPWKTGIRQNQEERAKSKGPFAVENGHLVHYRTTLRQGDLVTEPVDLCNFDARIIEVRNMDNGVELSSSYRIKGFDERGKPLCELDIDTTQFESMAWLARPGWAGRAWRRTGNSMKDYLREAIFVLSEEKMDHKTVFAHTGWKVVDGKRCFLTSSGALGAENIEVSLSESASRYSLPLKPSNPKEAMEASLRFLDASDRSITLPLWGFIYLAPLAEVLEPTFTLWVEGISGTFKSALCALALCHFGSFNYRSLPLNWSSTANQLEKSLSELKDIPAVIDDWAPGITLSEQRDLDYKAGRILRAQGNWQSRSRMTREMSEKKSYPPRGLLLTSGEQMPTGFSVNARVMVIRAEEGQTTLEKLFTYFREQGSYPHAMSSYILWLAARWEQTTKLNDLFESLESRVAKDCPGHVRLHTEIAWMQLGVETAIEFATSIGAMTEKDGAKLSAQSYDILLKAGQAHTVITNRERGAAMFIRVIKQLLLQGKVYIRNRNQVVSSDFKPWQEFVGWFDETHVYLEPDSAYTAVCKFSRQAGVVDFTWKDQALWRDLNHSGLSECSKGRNQFNIYVDGENKWVIKLKRELLGFQNEVSNDIPGQDT